MSKETLEAIDKAVREHWLDILSTIDEEVKPVITAWAVVAEIQTLEDGEVLWDNGYCVSETTSPNSALGMGIWMADEMREIRSDAVEEEGDGDD